MNRLLILILLLISLPGTAQIPADFPVIGKNDLPDAEFKPARHFTSESLYGYMNGGAELYREFGISDAVITEFDLDGSHYKCEVYKMNGPDEAFGIYSVSTFKCLSNPPLSDYTCQTKYQLQICKGQYYLSIINRSGTSADSLILIMTGSVLTEQIDKPSFDLHDFFPDSGHHEINTSTVLVKGKLGLANGAPMWEDYFSEITDYMAVLFSDEESTFISVKIYDPDEFDHFITSHGWGLCDMSVSDVKKPGGVTLRIIGDNHLLIKIEN